MAHTLIQERRQPGPERGRCRGSADDGPTSVDKNFVSSPRICQRRYIRDTSTPTAVLARGNSGTSLPVRPRKDVTHTTTCCPIICAAVPYFLGYNYAAGSHHAGSADR